MKRKFYFKKSRRVNNAYKKKTDYDKQGYYAASG